VWVAIWVLGGVWVSVGLLGGVWVSVLDGGLLMWLTNELDGGSVCDDLLLDILLLLQGGLCSLLAFSVLFSVGSLGIVELLQLGLEFGFLSSILLLGELLLVLLLLLLESVEDNRSNVLSLVSGEGWWLLDFSVLSDTRTGGAASALSRGVGAGALGGGIGGFGGTTLSRDVGGRALGGRISGSTVVRCGTLSGADGGRSAVYGIS